jgi:lipid-binding SYLF domain-containing protein
MKGRALSVVGALGALLACAEAAAAETNAELTKRFTKATEVLTEMASGRDAEIPADLLAQARAIAVFPGVSKGAVIFGGRYGQGVVSVRRPAGDQWSAPALFTIGGGSFGLQIGGQVVDLVLLIMTQKGVDSLLRSEFTLGGDATLAAGPKSLHEGADTDGRFKAEIFSYARSSGLFAGVSFEGASVHPDGDAIRRVYGSAADSRDVLLGTKYAAPVAARPFIAALRKYTPPPTKR